MAEFLLHSSVVWLNPLPRLGRRKEPKLTLFGTPARFHREQEDTHQC